MVWNIHHRYANYGGIPLWWDLSIASWEWALPLRIKVRPLLTDGSGRYGHVTRIELSLLCLHWDIHYAWGRRRYRLKPERILSLREVLERDLAFRDAVKQGLAEPLTPEQRAPHNDA